MEMNTVTQNNVSFSQIYLFERDNDTSTPNRMERRSYQNTCACSTPPLQVFFLCKDSYSRKGIIKKIFFETYFNSYAC